MSSIPSDLRYTKDHEWLRVEADGQVTVGITHYAQEALGDLVYVELPAIGKTVSQGAAMAVVESVKAASDVYAPLTGTIAAVNDTLPKAPESLNADPYGSWMVRITPAKPEELESLLSADAYAAHLA
jgi:glycine cleavage system H protein